jgi:hypothetical protein
MADEKLGIENIEEVLGAFLDVGIQAYQAYADDHKISTGEIVKLAFKVPSLWSAVKDIKPAVAEAKDLDPAELEKLMSFVLTKLGELGKIEVKEK